MTPRWTAGLAAWHAAAEAETTAAWALAHFRPATLHGAEALLRYVARWCEWPDLPEHDDGTEDWYCTLHASLAGALAALG